MDAINAMFDPKDLANIPWDHGRMDYENRVRIIFRRLKKRGDLRDANIDMSRVINNPITDLMGNQLGRDEHLYRVGRVDDVDHWTILGGGRGAGSIRIKVTLAINNIMKAAQVATNTIGDLYIAMLDHPGSIGPGFMITPAG